MTEIKAKLNHFGVAPRKTRLVCGLVRGMPVNKAISQLNFSYKKSSPALIKLIKSAISNAKANFRIDPENLYIKELKVDEGPMFKRYMPRARGRATVIRKKSSHISLILSEFKPKLKENKTKSAKKSGKKK